MPARPSRYHDATWPSDERRPETQCQTWRAVQLLLLTGVEFMMGLGITLNPKALVP